MFNEKFRNIFFIQSRFYIYIYIFMQILSPLFLSEEKNDNENGKYNAKLRPTMMSNIFIVKSSFEIRSFKVTFIFTLLRC